MTIFFLFDFLYKKLIITNFVNSRWVEDPKLTHVKYFRFNDEPVAAGLTEEEVMKIRQRLLNDESNFYSFHSSEEYKHKESLMEGQSMKMKKDSEKDIQEKLSKMQEKIKWERPRSNSIFWIMLT